MIWFSLNLSARLSTWSFYPLTLFQSEKCTWLFSNDFRGKKAEATQWLSSKDSVYSAEDAGHMGSIPGSGRFPGKGKKYSCLENPNAKSWTWLKWLSMHPKRIVSTVDSFYSSGWSRGNAHPSRWSWWNRHPWLSSLWSKSFLFSELTSTYKRFFPPLNSYESMKIVLEPNLQISLLCWKFRDWGEITSESGSLQFLPPVK